MSCAIALDMRTVPGPVTGSGAHAAQAPQDRADIARGTAHALAEGTRLLDYEIVGPIGEGGFGIVYLAWDHALEQHVAIKEYLPAVLASRASVSPAVVVKSQRHADSFRIGMRSFVNEARMLARFEHPSLVRVLRFWEANGTAYMAMPYYVGPTLARALAELGRPPDEAELGSWLRPLLDALGTMHADQCYHRDIAPDNILLTDNGPVLLDFGAARHVIEGRGKSPTVVFKPGFAPIEQYGEAPSLKQGAWTDLYALASVVYAAITGRPPTPSIERLMGDPLRPLSELAQGRYSARFLAAIDAALSLHPRNRPQSAAEFWTQLSGETPMDATPGDCTATDLVLPRIEPCTASWPPLRVQPGPAQQRRSRAKVSALAATVFLVGLVAAGYSLISDPVHTAPPPASLAAVPATPEPPLGPIAALLPPPFDTPEVVRLAEPRPLPGPTARPEALEPAPAPVAALPATPEPPLGPIAALLPAPPDAPEVVRLAEPRPLPGPTALPEAPEPAPAPAPVAAEPVRRTVVRASTEPARPTRREARSPAGEQPARLAAAHVAPSETAQVPIKCTDILQRASLEPLTSAEAALLKKGCG
jgi:serine/threonine protein kinase